MYVLYGWEQAVHGGMWLLYVLGGLGFIYEKRWGRVLTLLAAGGSLIAIIAGIVLYGVEIEDFSLLADWTITIDGLPALAIFISALLVKVPPPTEAVEKVPPPTEAVEKPGTRKRALRDKAYISFMVLGLISFWTSFHFYHGGVAGGSTSSVPAILVFVVFVPCGIPLLLALIFGPGLSVVHCRDDYRLMTLTAISIALVIALNGLGYETWAMFLAVYATVCMTIGLIWFVKYRRRFG
jgi:MFS family permease